MQKKIKEFDDKILYFIICLIFLILDFLTNLYLF